jgi:hypothetical protein
MRYRPQPRAAHPVDKTMDHASSHEGEGSTIPSCLLVVLLGCLGCGTSQLPGSSRLPASDHPTRDRIREAPKLPLDTAVRGSTEEPVPNIVGSCTGGGRAGTWSARVYRFTPPTTAPDLLDVANGSLDAFAVGADGTIVHFQTKGVSLAADVLL